MTAPAEAPPTVPEQQAVEQILLTLAAGTTAAGLAGALAGLPGIPIEAARMLFAAVPGLVELVQAHNAIGDPFSGGPVEWQKRQNLTRRAAYLINAARRMATALVTSRHDPGALTRAVDAETRHLRAHVDAVARRQRAAVRVAEALKTERGKGEQPEFDLLLGWYAVLDSRTSPDCRKANGKNFDPLRPPAIGLPGTVHPHCRCKPGPSHPTSQTVGGNALSEEPEMVKLANDHPSSSHPDIPNKPGKTNWVEKRGGLPKFIERVAKHIMADSGFSTSRAIASAISQCKKWAAGGGDVKPETRAKAAAAIAQWTAIKGKRG